MDQAAVDKLIGFRASRPAFVSVYLTVPSGQAGLRAAPDRLAALLGPVEDQAEAAGDREAGEAVRKDAAALQEMAISRFPEWSGRGVAMFACRELGILSAFPLCAAVPDRAMLGRRAAVRAPAAELRRFPDHAVAVVDRRHAWLFRVSGTGIEAIARREDEMEQCRAPGGWYGLETHHVQQRIAGFGRQHYRATEAALERAWRAGAWRLLVAAGSDNDVATFLDGLPGPLRGRFAGSFVVDPHGLTPGRIRELAGEVVERWVRARERRLIAGLADLPPGDRATGPEACVTAVDRRAVDMLVIPDDFVLPGHVCGQCGAIAPAGGESDENCPVCGGSRYPHPDLTELLAVTVLDGGGRVEPVRAPGPSGTIAARLRHRPVGTSAAP